MTQIYNRFISFTTTIIYNLIVIIPQHFEVKSNDPVIFNREVSGKTILLKPSKNVKRSSQSQ